MRGRERAIFSFFSRSVLMLVWNLKHHVVLLGIQPKDRIIFLSSVIALLHRLIVRAREHEFTIIRVWATRGFMSAWPWQNYSGPLEWQRESSNLNKMIRCWNDYPNQRPILELQRCQCKHVTTAPRVAETMPTIPTVIGWRSQVLDVSSTIGFPPAWGLSLC